MKHKDNPVFFNEAELPVNAPATDDAWDKMQERLEVEMPVEEKKKRRFLLFLFVLMLCLIFSGSLFLKNSLIKDVSTKITPINKSNAKQNKDFSSSIDKEGNVPIADENSSTSVKPQLKRNDEVLTEAIWKVTLNKQPKKAKAVTIAKKKSTAQAHTAVAENEIENAAESKMEKMQANDSATTAFAEQPVLTAKAKQIEEAAEQEENEKEEKEGNDKIKITGGLQWNFQLPLLGAANYFSSGNTKTAAWQNFIPGVWLSVSVQKHQLSAELNPYFTCIVPQKPFNEKIKSTGNADTIINTTTKTYISKLIGTAISFSYGYNFKSAWWLNGGVQAQWWRKGISIDKIKQEKSPVTNSSQIITTNYEDVHSTTIDEWEYANKFQLNLHAGVEYHSNKWQAAVRAGLPIAPISQTDKGPGRNLRTELLFRWKLFSKTINSSK